MESISLIFKVLWAPGEALFKVSKNRKALAPILFLTVCMLGYTLISFRYMDGAAMMIRAAEQSNPNLTPEQKSQFAAFANNPLYKALGLGSALIAPLFMVALVSVLYLGIFSLVGREAGFKSFFAVTAFAFVPHAITYIASAITVMVVPQSSLMLDEIGSISPAIFLDRTGMSKPLFAVVNSIDVITIWVLILLVIGYGFLVKKSVSTSLRVICVFGLWLVWVGFRALLASFMPS